MATGHREENSGLVDEKDQCHTGAGGPFVTQITADEHSLCILVFLHGMKNCGTNYVLKSPIRISFKI